MLLLGLSCFFLLPFSCLFFGFSGPPYFKFQSNLQCVQAELATSLYHLPFRLHALKQAHTKSAIGSVSWGSGSFIHPLPMRECPRRTPFSGPFAASYRCCGSYTLRILTRLWHSIFSEENWIYGTWTGMKSRKLWVYQILRGRQRGSFTQAYNHADTASYKGPLSW